MFWDVLCPKPKSKTYISQNGLRLVLKRYRVVSQRFTYACFPPLFTQIKTQVILGKCEIIITFLLILPHYIVLHC